jgi:S-formylglutathione hydrolase FrmB
MEVMPTTWLDGLGDWSWPGSAPALELTPAAWVPALPLPVALPRAAPRARPRSLPRALRLARLVALLAIGAATFVLSSGIARSGAVPATGAGARIAPGLISPFAAAATLKDAIAHPAAPLGVLRTPLPTAVPISTDRAGSTIARVTYPSLALGWHDSYLVYLPPGYRVGAARRYPVLYLLHGDKQGAASFLRLGLQHTLDRLISTHAIRPMIAVMLQANGLPDNWRNTPGPRYETYVSEVASLTDAILPTLTARASRGIAGYSMGGFGAMEVALSQLRRYSVVESWEGYFDNLSSLLAADRPLLARMPLHAFVYGGRNDTIADPAEDASWASALRRAGAQARSAVYPGGHTFTPLERHLAQMLTFAGRTLRG